MGHRSWKDRLGKRDFAATIERSTGARSIVEDKLARLLVAVAVMAILFCGLFPFDLVFRNVSTQISRRFDWTFGQYFTSGDTPENILFFMPLGFALGALLLRRRGQEPIAGILTVLIGAALSIAVEVLQCLLGERDPSITDIANNTIGSLAGFGVYLFIGRQFLIGAARWIEQMERKIGPATLGTITGIFAIAICVAPLILGAESSSLAGWMPNYNLALGNELGASRLWYGRISDVSIASKAASDRQLGALFAHENPGAIFGASLIAHYDLRGEPPFVDQAGNLPPLDLAQRVATQPARAGRAPSSGPTFPVSATAPARPTSLPATRATRPVDPTAPPWELSDDRWLRTAGPLEGVAHEISTSNQFTVAITASSARADQYQAARLLTISAGAYNRNFTLAQDAANLIVRVRTDITGPNAAAPEFVLRDVFTDSKPRRIVVTFEHALLSVFVDAMDWHGQARLTPEAAVIWSIYPRDYWKSQLDSNDSARLAIIYRTMTFLPLGGLCAATVNLLQRRKRERIIIASAIVAATIVLMEALITTLGAQHLAASHVIASAIAAFVGVLIVKIRVDTPWVRTR